MSKETSFNLYQKVTDQIIELLEDDIIPWRKPWASSGPPMNALSKNIYQGINLWLLMSLDYESNLYLTFEQVKKLGGFINRGEKGHIVVFWTVLEKSLIDPDKLDESRKQIPFLRYYKVFNVGQCNELPTKLLDTPYERQVYPVAVCEGIVQSMPNAPEIRFGKNKAYYHPSEDYVNMPSIKRFIDPEAYYGTLFHELVHSTGHITRLGRKSITEMSEFGSSDYSFEELVAELGSCYLCSYAGIGQKELKNSTAYIKGWLSKLKEDPKCILSASAQAQKAVDYILNKKNIEIQTKEKLERA